MSKAEFLTTTVEVSVDNFIFTVSGQVTKFDGFTKLYNENKDGEINLPSFKLKDSLSIKIFTVLNILLRLRQGFQRRFLLKD